MRSGDAAYYHIGGLMALFPFFIQFPGLGQSIAIILPVLKLFLLPVGGGIPAGVLLAHANDVAWPITTILYLVSDLILAIAFEPILRLIAAVCGKIPFLSRLSTAMKALTARSVGHFSGTSTGP